LGRIFGKMIFKQVEQVEFQQALVENLVAEAGRFGIGSPSVVRASDGHEGRDEGSIWWVVPGH
jgi:hypothetical protein